MSSLSIYCWFKKLDFTMIKDTKNEITERSMENKVSQLIFFCFLENCVFFVGFISKQPLVLSPYHKGNTDSRTKPPY